LKIIRFVFFCLLALIQYCACSPAQRLHEQSSGDTTFQLLGSEFASSSGSEDLNQSANQGGQSADQDAKQSADKNATQTDDKKKDAPNAPSATPRPGVAPVTAEGTSKDRLFYALPNFLTLENAQDVPPLTTKEKFKVVAKGSFDPVQVVWYGFLAGISQAENSEPGFGQGAEGYGKRYGAYFADGTIENFFTGAILPSIFRQDPRYFQSGRGSFWNRTGYAISRIFITRADSGRNEFNVSEVFGSAISAGISTYSYHPKSDRTLSNTASVWGSQVGYDTITLVVKEFWPDIRRKIRKQPKPENLPETH
jgi:hypothetical protein